jgi:hypothetical protein
LKQKDFCDSGARLSYIASPGQSRLYSKTLSKGKKEEGKRASKVAQWVKKLVAKSDDLNSVPGTYRIEGENPRPDIVL